MTEETKKPGLWVTDEELIRRSGVPYRAAKAAIDVLDKTPTSGFPRKNKLWGDRRYWPAVEAYFGRVGGLNMDAPQRRAS